MTIIILVLIRVKLSHTRSEQTEFLNSFHVRIKFSDLKIPKNTVNYFIGVYGEVLHYYGER